MFLSERPVYSPFVERARPAMAVLHGAFAFANDCYATLRVMELAPRQKRKTLQRYASSLLDKISASLSGLDGGVRWSNYGNEVRLAIRDCVRRLRGEM
jgi:hypothetical protein